MEQHIKNHLSLLQNIAADMHKYDGRKIRDLEVVLLEDGKPVLCTDLPTVLDYLANDIYWNEESDWRNANRAEVRVL